MVTRFGTQEVKRYRRYTDFKKLHKAISKELKVEAPFPAPSSKFGSRNLSDDF